MDKKTYDRINRPHYRGHCFYGSLKGAAPMVHVNQEVADRPDRYPKLQGALGRGQAAVELDVILQGFSLWETGPDGV